MGAATRLIRLTLLALDIVGIVTEGEFLRRGGTGTERRRPRWLEFLIGPGRLATEYVHSHGRKIQEVVTPEPRTIGEDTRLDEVATLMEKQGIKRLPVMRGDRVVGIVTRANLVHALASVARETRDTHPSDAVVGFDSTRLGLICVPQKGLAPQVSDRWHSWSSRYNAMGRHLMITRRKFTAAAEPVMPSLTSLGSAFARSMVFSVLAVMVLLVTAAQAQDDGARRILKAMSDYVASQKTISLTFDTDIEVITPDIQKIQFSSSGQVLLSRPDKLRASRTGGYADVELVFDGKIATVLGKNVNAFAQVDSPGSIDALIDRLRNDYSIDMPGADLLLVRVYDELIADVIDAKHIGQGVIDGVECEHLAFRNAEVDWQLWVDAGAHPIPRKYVITSKTVTGAPQYTLRIKQWSTDAPVSADAFAFKPPADARKVEAAALREIDEVPPGVVIGGRR